MFLELRHSGLPIHGVFTHSWGQRRTSRKAKPQHFIKLINKITTPSGGPSVGRFLELESYGHFWTHVQTLDVIGMGGHLVNVLEANVQAYI